MTLVSQAEYARRLGVSSAAVAQSKKAGKLVLQGVKVDVNKYHATTVIDIGRDAVVG
jgi:biotin operon repressor